MHSIKSLKRAALAVAALGLAAGCGSAESEDAQTDDALHEGTASSARDLREAISRCTTERDPSFRYACLRDANDTANRIVDAAQAKNYPGIAFAGYVTSTIPYYRDTARKLCAAEEPDGLTSLIDSCRAERERELAYAIMEYAFGAERAVLSAIAAPSKCAAPGEPPDGKADEADSTYASYAECLVGELKATFGAPAEAHAANAQRVCDPIATAGDVGKGKRAISIRAGRCATTMIQRLTSALSRRH